LFKPLDGVQGICYLSGMAQSSSIRPSPVRIFTDHEVRVLYARIDCTGQNLANACISMEPGESRNAVLITLMSLSTMMGDIRKSSVVGLPMDIEDSMEVLRAETERLRNA
jgi:hypothetical protein